MIIVGVQLHPFMSTVYQSSNGCFQQDNTACRIISPWFVEHDNELTVVKWPPVTRFQSAVSSTAHSPEDFKIEQRKLTGHYYIYYIPGQFVPSSYAGTLYYISVMIVAAWKFPDYLFFSPVCGLTLT